MDATVTVVHSRTKNIKAEMILDADIIIAALGSPDFVKEDMVKERCCGNRCRYNTY